MEIKDYIPFMDRSECGTCSKKKPRRKMQVIHYSWEEPNGETGMEEFYLCRECADEIAYNIEQELFRMRQDD